MTPRGVMANLKLLYVKSYTDKTGVRRHYFRRKGHPGGPLPGKVGSTEFMEAYQGFMSTKPVFAGKPKGTLGRVITDYYQTADFKNLADNSKKLYKGALEPVAAEWGHNTTAALTQDRVINMIEKIGARAPQMANLTRSVLLKVLSVAHTRKWIPRLITGKGITTYKGGTHHTWTADELAAYEARWPLGTRERLAYAAYRYTGQRGGDVTKLSRRDALAGSFTIVQQKTGAAVDIPVAPQLLEAIKAMPANGVTVIGDKHGRPIQRRTLTKIIKKAVKEAGLPARCVPHGLRKALLTELAEEGASDRQLASISGHKNTEELKTYTQAANQKILARDAMAKLTKKRT